MRTRRTLRTPSAVHATAGVLMLALPASAVALNAGAAVAQTSTAESGGRQATVDHTLPLGLADRGPYTIDPTLWPLSPSAPPRIEVGATFSVSHATQSAPAGSPVTIHGRLLPGTAGRTVALLARRGTGWARLAQARTGIGGGFALRYVVPGTGSQTLRVSFAGDGANRAVSASAGEVVGMQAAVASWYYDAGTTACGFHATYGVASKTLPCGTKVTFAYGGRTVTATVDDRGPYVAGRDFDLDQSTAQALGMGGVATVEAST